MVSISQDSLSLWWLYHTPRCAC